jgi:ketosteroid isomerase-like protein
MTTDLPKPIADYFSATNALDLDALVATFAEDALVNDIRREFLGTEAIRDWARHESIGDKVTVEVIDVVHHYGDVIVSGQLEGDFDRTGLPDPVVLTYYFSVRDDRIVKLIIILNGCRDR